LAVSESGISEPVFFKAGLAVNKEVYISKCLPVLHKFIQKRQKKSKGYVDPIRWLKIEYVPKEENPPNVPQIRPIEKFWANLKRKVYSNNYRPKDVKCLMAIIRKELNSIETTGIRKAMKEVPAKTRKAHRLGLIFFFSRNLCIV
jgi:transposase